MELVNNGIDLTQLRTALASFSAIQELKLLRLQDEADEHMLDFIRDHSFTNGTSNLESTTRFDWESACSRAVTNLGISLLGSQCPSIRFIGPQISPEATLQLLQAPSTTLAAMGPRLTSLDITFHSSVDISPTMSDLSDVFYNFFREAKNLVAIHMGFPTKHPISLPLNSIFHNIRWKTLRSLTLQGWRLTSEDLISLIRRHHRQLRDLNLSSIYLQSGKWSSVLNVLRHEMDHLDHLQLREIDYAAHFDEISFATGVEVFDPIPLPPSSSSSVSVATGPSPPSSPDLVPSLPVALLRYHRVSHRRDTLEKVWGLSVDELGDDGIHVRPDQEWFWEAWVLASRWDDREGLGHDFSISGNANGNGNGFVKSNENGVGSH